MVKGIYGDYNEHGYSIFNEDGEELYRAGNHALDSQQDGTGTQHQLSLETIRGYCQQTAKEIAEEQNGVVLYISYSE